MAVPTALRCERRPGDPEPSAVLRNTLINSILPNSLALRGLVEKNDFICVRIDA
jgi:hypothetical protein